MGFFSSQSAELEAVKDLLESQNGRIRDLLRELRSLEDQVERTFRDWEERVGTTEKRVRLMAEEMEERIDRGNKIWRRIRASQRYEEEHSDGEEEPEEEAQYLLPVDGNGSQRSRLPSMYGDLGIPGNPLQPYQEIARALARRRAGHE